MIESFGKKFCELLELTLKNNNTLFQDYCCAYCKCIQFKQHAVKNHFSLVNLIKKAFMSFIKNENISYNLVIIKKMILLHRILMLWKSCTNFILKVNLRHIHKDTEITIILNGCNIIKFYNCFKLGHFCIIYKHLVYYFLTELKIKCISVKVKI